MSDQCLNCNHFNRPDMCIGVRCTIKESWYVLYLSQQITALTAELKSLTEAYNNTDWKKRTDEQKEIINNLTVRWGKVIRENAALTAEKKRQSEEIRLLRRALGNCNPEFIDA